MKVNNFCLFCDRKKEISRKNIEFKAEEIKRDADMQFYNSVLVSVTDEIVAKFP